VAGGDVAAVDVVAETDGVVVVVVAETLGVLGAWVP